MASLQQWIQRLESVKHAPTEQWNPPYCGEIPISIDSQGRWFYQGSEIARQKLVQLFASVLVVEEQQYYLVTPAEKVKISVADVPFVITDYQQASSDDGETVWLVETNVGDKVAISDQHPLEVRNGIPYVTVYRGLQAKLHRNVFYRWVDMAEVEELQGVSRYFIRSAGKKYLLGEVG
ncbi:DUF1285 domain-containing protein [Idiomarina tyrosinivorans]|uniref:DUF1285 domain-containing protein n=1 Tax=Idiomarina tyrosinivorans TaxID=1445662 RepID=A0A432ZSH7_9GAMM|nr:DUF1285 domain-containing protein [Idiomarina tyrosinivorans]RUO80875.1 DUF1285 domain-containing protein [Idiomarina tyrosinivorans]